MRQNTLHTSPAENADTSIEQFSLENVHPQYRMIALDLGRRISRVKIGGRVDRKKDIFSNEVGNALNEAFWARMNVREISKGVRKKISPNDDTKIVTTTEMLHCLNQILLHEILSGNLVRTGHRKGMDEFEGMERLLDVSDVEWDKDPQKAECLEILKLELFWRHLNLANRALLSAEKRL